MTLGTLGFDNIAVAFALGPLRLGWRRIGLLGLAFGVAEAGMTLLGASGFGGSWLPAMTASDAARAGVLATLAVALVGLAWIRCLPADIVGNIWTLLGMSLLLGLDNLIAGRGLDGPAFSLASVGAASMLTAGLAAAACAVGSTMFPLAHPAGASASALMLMALAVAGIA